MQRGSELGDPINSFTSRCLLVTSVFYSATPVTWKGNSDHQNLNYIDMTRIPDKYKYGASRGLYKTTRFFPVTWIKKLSMTWNKHSKREVSQELRMNT